MAYLRLTYRYGGIEEILEHHSSRYGVHTPRNVLRRPTAADVKKANDRRKGKQLNRILAENFTDRDIHLTLTHREVPEDYKADIQRFLSAARRHKKKEGSELKYVLVTEQGKRKVHHHIVTNLTDLKTIRRLWPHGSTYVSPLYTDRDYCQLADYLTKQKRKKNEKGYSHSRNLVIPKAEVEVISSRAWAKRPYPRQGWFIRKDSVFSGINGDGYPWREYVMEPIRPVKEKEAYWIPRGYRMKSAGKERWIPRKGEKREKGKHLHIHQLSKPKEERRKDFICPNNADKKRTARPTGDRGSDSDGKPGGDPGGGEGDQSPAGTLPG